MILAIVQVQNLGFGGGLLHIYVYMYIYIYIDTSTFPSSLELLPFRSAWTRFVWSNVDGFRWFQFGSNHSPVDSTWLCSQDQEADRLLGLGCSNHQHWPF